MCELVVHEKSKITLNQFDPSRTTGIRQAFIREVNRRFKLLIRTVKKAIVTEDVFGLLDSNGKLIANVHHYNPTTPGFKRFSFPRSADKVSAFMEWFNGQVEAGVLQVSNIRQVGSAVENAWTNLYIQDSYKRGVTRARYQLKEIGIDIPPLSEVGGIGAVMGTPFHLDRLGLLYTRTFNELKGITNAMDQQISRVLANGLAEGLHPRTLAKQLDQVISGIGRSLEIKDSLGRTISAQRRAQMLARTETIRAHAQAQLQEFNNWGIIGVEVQAEFQTAGDDRVCAECAGLEGQRYSIAEASNIIPVHTNCRCAWIPVLMNEP